LRVLVLRLHLRLPGCRSLKQRRSILESLKNRLRRDLNLSVSEVEPRDIPDRTTLGVASVVDHRASGDSQRTKIRALLERERRVQILEEECEYC
jgi:hypothetical protein